MPDFSPIVLDANNPGPMTAGGNRTYLLVGRGGDAALVDAGVGDERHLAALADALRAHRSILTQVLVTHGHPDHASGAPRLAQRHPLAGFAKYPWPGEDARYRVVWRPLADADQIAVGDETLAVLYTPGHCPDHVAFWHESTRTAFTGDLIVGGRSAMIHWSRGGDLAAYLSSLERLRRLQPRRLLPGHGNIVEDPEEVLAGAIAHRLMREQQVLNALHDGVSTVPAVTDSLYHGLDPALRPAARESVRAHLEKLKAERRAFSDGEHWGIQE